MLVTHRGLLTVGLLVALGASSSAAQQGTITGQVLDGANRIPVTGAQVSVGVAATQANAQGSFTIRVTPGTVTVAVVAPGYLPYERVPLPTD